MENMNLIRKIAWSFHTTTGLPIDELIAEASLAYVECLPGFDATKCKLSTFAYNRMRNHLIDYCRGQQKYRHETLIDDLDDNQSVPDMISHSVEDRTVFKDLLLNQSEEVKYVAWMVFQSPAEFLGTYAKGNVKDKLREHGWTWAMIWRTFAEVKALLKEAAIS